MAKMIIQSVKVDDNLSNFAGSPNCYFTVLFKLVSATEEKECSAKVWIDKRGKPWYMIQDLFLTDMPDSIQDSIERIINSKVKEFYEKNYRVRGRSSG